MAPEISSEVNYIAVHEAGHVVLGKILGIPVESATIEPTNQYVGMIVVPGRDELWDFWQRNGKDHRSLKSAGIALILTAFGGLHATEELLGCYDSSDEDADAAFATQLVWATFSDDEAERYIPRMRRQTRRLIRKHSNKIERVAATLVERRSLSTDELDELIDT